ncbi:TM7S3/TM198-like domain-containing protein [Blautia sp. HCP28S3_G10]|uniref:TM7S3/TM198-like domain-containing protein n=1 Tax=Blautia sp. HCP28S3_G10 TaxID=3438908 RepID=UPI003F8C8EF7
MTDILQQAMNMLENQGTLPQISSFAVIGFGVLFVLGVVNCILGYRLLRFWMMLFGFLIGAGLGVGVAYSTGVQEKYMYAVFAVVAGVVLAAIAFVSYKVGIFILGMGIGLGLGTYVIHPTTSLTFFFCLMLGVGLGVMAMKQARVILIVGTSLLGGAMAGFSLARLGNMADIPYGVGLSVGFALLGMLIQFATNRVKVYDDEEDETEIHKKIENAEKSSDYIDPQEYLPQRSEKKKRKDKQRESREESRRSSEKRRESSRREHRPADIRLKPEKKNHRYADAAPEYEKTVEYRPGKKNSELDLPLDSYKRKQPQRMQEYYGDDIYDEEPIDEDLLDDEVVREMMDEDDREGEELWNKLTGRQNSGRSRNRKEGQHGKRS